VSDISKLRAFGPKFQSTELTVDFPRRLLPPTQLTGEYKAVMAALTEAMQPTLSGELACSFVIKVLNVGIDPGAEVNV